MTPVDEILLSSDKTVAIIDGSGVLADPAGLNREELIRLAKLRIPVANFDKSKLSKEGYLVKVEEQDVKLPCMCPLLSLRVCADKFGQKLVRSCLMGPTSVTVPTCASRPTCSSPVEDGKHLYY